LFLRGAHSKIYAIRKLNLIGSSVKTPAWSDKKGALCKRGEQSDTPHTTVEKKKKNVRRFYLFGKSNSPQEAGGTDHPRKRKGVALWAEGVGGRSSTTNQKKTKTPCLQKFRAGTPIKASLQGEGRERGRKGRKRQNQA